jgi:hypothetical protein
VQSSLLAALPEVAFAAALVFIDMLDSDGAAAAATAAARFSDPRVRCFHDPAHRAGRALAQSLVWRHHVAWDCYLFYRPGVRWDGEQMLHPELWFHQLRDREVREEQACQAGTDSSWTQHLAERSEAPPERFRTGVALVEAGRVAGHGP